MGVNLKIVLYDQTTEIEIQSCSAKNDELTVVCLNNDLAELIVIFKQEDKTQVIQVVNDGTVTNTYRDYTKYVSAREYSSTDIDYTEVDASTMSGYAETTVYYQEIKMRKLTIEERVKRLEERVGI